MTGLRRRSAQLDANPYAHLMDVDIIDFTVLGGYEAMGYTETLEVFIEVIGSEYYDWRNGDFHAAANGGADQGVAI